MEPPAFSISTRIERRLMLVTLMLFAAAVTWSLLR
jgi:hypothetical protein